MHVFIWAHAYLLNYFVVFIYSDLGTMRQLLGRECIGVNGSICMYYWKYMIRRIRKSCKITKALIVEFVLFVPIITTDMVMTRKVGSDSDPNGHEESISGSINMQSELIGLENHVLCSDRI